MFCYQCEQTAKGEGCTTSGVCGKQPDVAALQDLLLYAVKGLSQVALEGRKVGVKNNAIDRFTCEATFSTLTNVDFDADRFVELIRQTVAHRDDLKQKVGAAGGWTDFTGGPVTFVPSGTTAELVAQGEKVGVQSKSDVNPDIVSLQEIIVYGIKGVAAYADHAAILGREDDRVYDYIYEGLAATLDNDKTADELLGLVLKCGEANLWAMELLDAANTGTYGHPVPTQVPLGAKAGKAILVSGDQRQLFFLLNDNYNSRFFSS
jgi:hydroxylamine reductase